MAEADEISHSVPIPVWKHRWGYIVVDFGEYSVYFDDGDSARDLEKELNRIQNLVETRPGMLHDAARLSGDPQHGKSRDAAIRWFQRQMLAEYDPYKPGEIPDPDAYPPFKARDGEWRIDW